MLLNGKLIAFEGCPGSAAQKKMEAFKSYLDSLQITCEIVRLLDPSTIIGSVACSAYYDYFTTYSPKTIDCICNAERYSKQEEIQELLQRGVYVLIDRYILCAISESLALSEKPFELGVLGDYEELLRPDMVVYFESMPEDGLIAAPFCIFASLSRLRRLHEAYVYTMQHFYYFNRIIWFVHENENNFCQRLLKKINRSR